jgi:hypothetical protein
MIAYSIDHPLVVMNANNGIGLFNLAEHNVVVRADFVPKPVNVRFKYGHASFSVDGVVELFVGFEKSLEIICCPCGYVATLDLFKAAYCLLTTALCRLLSSRAF